MRIVAPYNLEVLNAVIYEYQSLFFPLQLLFFALALFALYWYWYQKSLTNQIVTSILALFWFWSGFVYLGIYYEQINWFGFYASIIFFLQALLLLWYGVIKQSLYFQKSLLSITVSLSVIILLPLLQMFSGVGFYEVYVVGMLPLSTVAFSVGLSLSLSSKKVLHISLIPLLWSSFSLYWSYLLKNQFSVNLSSLCLLGVLWVVYRGFRR
ncbi:MAG: DUF6064 family protein [Campylobacterales bacterium]